MNFSFDDDQKQLGETVAQVLADFPKLVGPDLSRDDDDAVWRALGELGLFALLVPEDYGGVGLTLVDLALAVEALGAGLAPPIVISTLIATDAIVRHGSDEQRLAWLPLIGGGELRVAIAHLEAEQGYDPSTVQTSVVQNKLGGKKIAVAGAADADLLLCISQVNGLPSLVIVDCAAGGISIRAHDDLDPTSGLCAVSFEGLAIDGRAILSARNANPVERLLDTAAALYAGLSIGIAARMLAASVDYAKTRSQFGQPIGTFQAIKHRCADMAVAVEAGRSAAYYAFWSVAENAPDQARAASMAKAYCGEITRSVCNETIQVHGGMGFTWELGLHRYLRRAKVIEHAFGDQEWHNERIIAQTLAGVDTPVDRQLDAA